jgi:hypothetical protein
MFQAIMGLILLFLSLPFLFVFWPLGIVMAYIGTQVLVNNND